MKKTNFIFSFIVFILFSFYAYSEHIVNPINGIWANKQVLVVTSSKESNVYYSLSGEDPETSGIAYDGPALIDAEGKVSIVVAIIDKDGNKTLEKVEYEVKPAQTPENEDAYNFIQNASLTGFLDYSAGDILSIPKSLEYSFGSQSSDLETGTELSINKNSVLSRALPLNISDGKSFWRFVILISPVAMGQFSQKNVPFEISEWENVSFKDKKLIYKIDDSWWELPKTSVKLDRSKSHMISWQDVDYNPENPIKFFVLPPKPEIKTQKNEFGEVTVSLKGEEGYKFGILESNENSSGFFDELTVDTFNGDNFKGTIEAGIYFDSVYQGKLSFNFDVHKKIPSKPQISSSVQGTVIRSETEISIKSTEKNKIFASILGPVVLEDDYSVQNSSDTLFKLSNPEYIQLKKSTFKLSSNVNGAAAYKILAYCADSSGLKSKTSEYFVIIDNCNFYVDSTNVSEEAVNLADGSLEHPFTTFGDVLPLLKNSRYIHVRISGEVFAPNEKISINSNCTFEGKNGAKLNVAPNTLFNVKNSSLELKNIIVSLNEYNDSESSSLFYIERGVLYLNNVELGCLYGKNGTLVNADNSVINIENSGITLNSTLYSCVISSVKSKVSVKKSRISAVASTAVAFSAQGGLFELKDSSCKVTGSMGRVAELFDTYSKIAKNSFVGELKKTSGNNSAIYFDSKNNSVEYSENYETGF